MARVPLPPPDALLVDPKTGLINKDWYDFFRNFSGGQLAFPPTQNQSSDPNTLDDYEEGTWTPVLTFATPPTTAFTYSVQNGVYTKIGQLVVAHFAIATATFNTAGAAGDLRITGLPFTVASIGGGNSPRGSGVQWQGITKANYTQMVMRLELNDTFMNLIASGSGQTNVAIASADTPSGGSFILRSSASYFST